jgi:hypothetical protein
MRRMLLHHAGDSKPLTECKDVLDRLGLRRWASWFGRINLLLALVVVALGVMLVRGRPW